MDTVNGINPSDNQPDENAPGPDGYRPSAQNPRQAMHATLSRAMADFLSSPPTPAMPPPAFQAGVTPEDRQARLQEKQARNQILMEQLENRQKAQEDFAAQVGSGVSQADPAATIAAIQAVMERLHWQEEQRRSGAWPAAEPGWEAVGSAHWHRWHRWRGLVSLLEALLARDLPHSEGRLRDLLETVLSDGRPGEENMSAGMLVWFPLEELLTRIGAFASAQALPDGFRAALQRLRIVEKHYVRSGMSSYHGGCYLPDRIDALLGEEGPGALRGGEAWADAARADLAVLNPAARAHWNALLAHAGHSDAAKPSKKWLAEAQRLVEPIGAEAFRARLIAWFGLTQKATFTSLLELNAGLLKGLVWCCILFDDPGLCAAVGDVALAAYKKIPGIGARSMKVGNACVGALGAMPGLLPVVQLSRLKQRVKYQVAQGLIGKAFTEAAARANLPSADLEELAVPTFGLEEGGRLRESAGDFTAELAVAGPHTVEVRWTSQDGAVSGSPPVAVKKSHPEVVSSLKKASEEIRKALPAQRDRMERLLLTQRSWPLAVWRERYLDHPLLAALARPLIWRFQDIGENSPRSALGIWQDGRLVDERGEALNWLTDTTQVRLWHPLGFAPETVLAWRRRLEDHGTTQPFKQAHREIYLLTDAELATETYSNRFAAHILRQHQFSALCRQRGWQYRLQGHFDGHNVPTLTLPEHNLRVEFWVETAEGDNALSESYIHLYVSTDQVRFYRGDGPILPLREVPALLLTEILRDVDLFVGVCSVGNDPNWRDGGAVGQIGDYWQDYAFGDLNASAQTRKDVLSRLLPRLKIADRCTLDGKFLRVRGDRRTYKIHLGSGNILMEPNDQYLCIVPDLNAAKGEAERVFLPFEGDQTLSVILSKAFLLADDSRIQDATITRQIRGE